MRSRLLLVAAIVAGGLAVPTSAWASTSATPDGNVVKITIPVDVAGAKGARSPDGSTTLIEHWQRILDDTWGQAFDAIPYKDCYLLELRIRLTARADDFDGAEGRHRVIVSAPTGGRTFDGTGFDGVSETSSNPRTGDGTRSFEHDRDGAIPADAAPTVVAHEFGHLMGLGDDRAAGAPKPGRNNTMMVGGVPGVDVNVVQTIDRDLIDRIGKVIERYLKDTGQDGLPECERWKGSLEGTFGVGCVDGKSTGTISVGVVDGDAVGTLDISHGASGCQLAAGFTGVLVKGSKSRRAFTMGTKTGSPGDFDMRLAITGPRASGTFSFPTIPSSVDVKLRCTAHCPAENS